MLENQGWIKIHRKFLNWEWYTEPEMVRLFLHLLLSANHDDGQWKGYEIKRGQLITGRNSISKQTGISPQTVRTCLTRLKSTNEITIKPTNKFSLISILNYDKYQQDERKSTNKSTSQLTNNQPATNQQLTTNNNNKKENNDKEGRTIPPTLKMVQVYCEKRGNNIDPQYFIDKNTATGWMYGKTKMKDWQAVIRTWENNEKKWNKDKPQQSEKEMYARQMLRDCGDGDIAMFRFMKKYPDPKDYLALKHIFNN